jgi:hypothetical protein
MGTGPFPGVKRPGRGVDQTPTSSAEVKERVELCSYPFSGSSWPVLGRTLPLPLPLLLIQIRIILSKWNLSPILTNSVFGQHIYYLFNIYTIWSTYILFGQHIYYLFNIHTIWSTYILFGQHIYYLVNIYTICSTYILFGQHIHYLVNIYTIRSTYILFVQHICYFMLIFANSRNGESVQVLATRTFSTDRHYIWPSQRNLHPLFPYKWQMYFSNRNIRVVTFPSGARSF